MSNVVVGILGLITIVAIVVTLFRSKTQPAIAFIVFPAILGLILVIAGRYSFDNLATMIKSGFSSTGPTAALFVFSVLYFGIMTDAGMFDVIIGKLMKLVGDNVIGVAVVTAIIALVGHLDGGGASTFCIVVPAMLPVYKRMHMRPTTLLRIAVLAMGVLNLMPWAGPTMRAASVLGIEAGSLWQTLLPIQIFGVVLSLAHAGTDVAGLKELPQAEDAEPSPNALRYALELSFLALYGASSPLPTFYTEELIGKLHISDFLAFHVVNRYTSHFLFFPPFPKDYLFPLTVSLIVTRAFFAPGTAPFTRRRFFSASTRTT